MYVCISSFEAPKEITPLADDVKVGAPLEHCVDVGGDGLVEAYVQLHRVDPVQNREFYFLCAPSTTF